MIRLLFAALLVACTWAGGAGAQDWTEDEFDARLLSMAEKRIVQAALTLSGDYVGLLDGECGRRSQGALETYTRRSARDDKPKFRHLAPLLSALEAERQDKGWDTYHSSATGMSYAVPHDWVTFDEAESEGKAYMKFTSPSEDFIYFLDFSTGAAARGLHRTFREDDDLRDPPYSVDGHDRIVTSVTYRSGALVYARTDATDRGVITLVIMTTPAHRHRMALMSASIRPGNAPGFEVPRGGLLARVVAPAAKPAPASPSARVASTPAPAPSPAPQAGSGTGFYVDANRLVTAAHVIEGCGRITLADGTALSVVRQDRGLDLAVLAAPRGSPVWISPVIGTKARLGEPVTAVGFPYLGTLGQGLTVTAGNVSALQGIAGDTERIMISAPVQPGNSGGPLLNRGGTVVGVVVSRVNDLTVLKQTGSLPQNMNFAVTAERLTAFLIASGVAVGAPGTVATQDMSDGIPDAIAAAVVPVMCHG
jgi:serine protease Do